ncbi:MAG: hypothetical protein PGN29_06390 [Gordonia paraffinivorans]
MTDISDRDATGTGLPRLARPARADWKLIAFFLVVGIVVTVALSSWQRPVYRAESTLYVTARAEVGDTDTYTAGLAATQRMTSYRQLVTSDMVLADAIQTARLDLDTDQARSMLTTSTDAVAATLQIDVRSTDRAEARALAQAVADSTVSAVRQIEQPAGGGEPLAAAIPVTRGMESSRPVAPNLPAQLLLSLAVGLVVAVGLVLVKSRVTTRIRTAADVAAVTRWPVLAEIPGSGGGLRRGTAGDAPAVEAFRGLRTAIAFMNVDEPSSVIGVTSCQSDDGAAAVATHLAVTIAEAGQSVVLVDASLRRPALHPILGLPSTAGLAEAVSGTVDLAEVLQETNIPTMSFIAAGAAVPTASSLLASERARDLIGELARAHDFVVVYSPPVLLSAEAVSGVRWADLAIVAVQMGLTTTRQLRRTADSMRHAGVVDAAVVASAAGR